MIGQQLAKILIDAIVSNEIHGGEKLVENQLQKKFGVSRSPIREAIRDLEKIGLVEILPRRGTVVKKISRKDIEEDYAVRSLLEGLAAKEAYANLDEKALTRMEQVLETMRAAVKDGNITGYWRAHNDFHSIFINASGNGLLIAILGVLRIHSLRSRLVYPCPDEDLGSSLEIHEKIMKMFKSPDTDVNNLHRFVTQHILDTLPVLLCNVK
jgi:DNA-binding GntR family transcriptional regulator